MRQLLPAVLQAAVFLVSIIPGDGAGLDKVVLLQTEVHAAASEAQAAGAHRGLAVGDRFRQVMRNYGDVQYVSNITVGGQVLGGILDTGSFELVVFARTCSSCGLAGLYEHQASRHYREGLLVGTHRYGSGNLHSEQAFDRVQLGPIVSEAQAFWEVTRASMPLLDNANFAAIVGIGPPPAGGSEAAHAEASVGAGASAGVLATGTPAAGAPAAGAGLRGFLGGMNVSLFSVCLGSRPGSDGYFVWNDVDPRQRPGVFAEVRVVGTRSWGVMLTGARLTHSLFSVDLGCHQGCGAIMDSGTSLLVVPPTVIDQVSRAVESLNADCSNLHMLPTLVFSLGGRNYSLPPDAYVGDESMLPPSSQPRPDDDNDEHFQTPHRCRLLLMETDTQTQFGPMWVLGMPFFRKYYTTFDLGQANPQIGGGSTNRSVYTARASPLCTPVPESRPPATSLLGTGRRLAINTSQVVVSPWIQAATTESYVHI